MKTLKHFTILILLATTTLMACKKEETKAKDGELTIIVQPTVPDVNVVEGIFIKVYDPSDWTLLQEKEFWVKKGEFKFTNLPKKNIYVVARMEYIIVNNRRLAKDQYTFEYDGSGKTITLKPQ
jgi:hypothetical protein